MDGQIPTQFPSILQRTFVNRAGLRSGWSVLIFLILVAVPLVALTKARHKLFPDVHSPQDAGAMPVMILSEVVFFLAVLLATWIMSKIEHRALPVYGLARDSRWLRQLFAGMLWGVGCLALLVFALWKAGLLVIDSLLLRGGDAVFYGADWFLGFVFVGLFEEYLSRGYLQYTLTRGLAGFYQAIFQTRHSTALGFWTAALVLSILFGLGHGHNPGESPIGLLAAGIVALVFCFSLWRTGSLWWAIGFHASWDWAESFLFGVADSGIFAEHRLLATHPVGDPLFSGGTTGPEGSIVILPIVLLIALIIRFTLPRSGGSYGANLSPSLYS